MNRALVSLPGEYVVCRFPPDAPLPAWVFHASSSRWSITRTDTELSVVCDQDDVPPSVTPAPITWAAFEVEGPIPFEETGVIAKISAPLAAAGIPIFVVSTHDTDLVLVPEKKIAAAREAWSRAGIVVGSQRSFRSRP